MSTDPSTSESLSDTDLEDYHRLATELWHGEGVDQKWIDCSRENGMDAKDAASLSEFAKQERYLLVIRCPKANAHALHRVINRPKPVNVKTKSLADGVARDVREVRRVVVREDGRSREVTVRRETEYTSDYDLMCIYKVGNQDKLHKVVVAPKDKPPPDDPSTPWRGAFTIEARDLMRKLNRLLVVKLRHGCQDDMHSKFNPGLSARDRFAVFQLGEYHFFRSREGMKEYYRRMGIVWQYGPAGTAEADLHERDHHMLKAYRKPPAGNRRS